MVPPFIAYFGAYQQGDAETWLLQAAYDQCRLYRNYLQDPTTKLWKHVALGSWEDPNLWATGNGWASAGMLRVFQTISNSGFSTGFSGQTGDLLNWTEEIVKASWAYQVRAIPWDRTTPISRSLISAYRRLMVPSETLSTTPARSLTPPRPP